VLRGALAPGAGRRGVTVRAVRAAARPAGGLPGRQAPAAAPAAAVSARTRSVAEPAVAARRDAPDGVSGRARQGGR